MILSICENPKVLEISRLINIFITIIRIVVPIALIFSLMFKLVGAITKSDEDGLSKVKKIAPKNLIAAAIIFLVPTIVRLVVRLTASDISYENCLRVVSISEINSIYNKSMDELLIHAEETLSMDDYNTAYKYVKNIKDSDARKEYEERLAEVKTKIDGGKNPVGDNDYSKVDYSNFKWNAYKNKTGPASSYYSNIINYGVWAPENVSDLNGVSLPLIVWLHGSGELSYQPNMSIENFTNVAFTKVIRNWNKYNLEPIPAIIVAPQASGTWQDESIDKHMESIVALIKYAQAEYNIDANNIVLMGHSIGGNGVVYLSYEMQNKYGVDYFNKLVIMSGTRDLKYPNNNLESGYNYFSKKEVLGYSEDERCKPFFTWINEEENFKLYKGTSHGSIPEKALTDDSNNDGVSDLIYLLFGKNQYNNSKDIAKRYIIGDSKTVNMFYAINSNVRIGQVDLQDGTAIFDKDIWICKSAEGLSWMKNNAIPIIENKLDDESAIIILMGANGVDADQYIQYLDEKVPIWTNKGVRVYFVSVLPTDGQFSYLNSEINTFNSKIQQLKNVKYIDVHSHLISTGFNTIDGLHYSDDTSVKIYKYIMDNL